MLASKKAEYETILKKNMDNARTKTLAAQSRDTRQAAKKRARASSESASESEDSLCAKSELQEAINQKNFWKKRAKELDEERLFLREQVKSLQRCLESKIFQLDTKLAGAQQADGKSATEFSCTPTLPSSEQATAVCTQPTATPGTSQEQEKAANSSHPAEDTEVAHLPREDFTYLDDGSFHLSKGIIITAAGAAKILQNKKGTLVCKDAAHAIWGPDTLAVRSVRGVVASTKKALGEEPKQPLTPEKIGVIVATVKHWGLQRGVDVDPVVKNINRILSEKIQDIVKSKRKE
ncbi:hypothetical protein V5799_009467 [Amblyomma americanum]|uniref:BEN domain-containing protein n=1 Tax=Amblyomma americanum TaxID=6943 RepID=A0AAQ4FC59_AMBAM